MNAIETKALTRRFGDKTAVDALELTVPEGELFALLGVNGADRKQARQRADIDRKSTRLNSSHSV